MTSRLPSYFISHGGGPWPWIPDMNAALAPLAESLARMPAEIGQLPKAVLMISGHWEAERFTVMTSPRPPMVYDYFNFPPETYEIRYPAPGAPDVAKRAADLIAGAGLPVATDAQQGFDHGTFVPMAVMFPDADVPLFQISMRRGYSPAEHFALGRALAPLRDEGVLIVGSGLSYHNLSEFGPRAKAPSEAFDAWLNEVMSLPSTERTEALLNWESAPCARACHAQEDHLVPLFVALGAAEEEVSRRVYHQKDIFGGVTASSFRFG
jgi:aromatic ring-opening dioxygenase catalytic subunit (LigB family)